jgi:hypothetical protein
MSLTRENETVKKQENAAKKIGWFVEQQQLKVPLGNFRWSRLLSV